jgi:class 3 adenylate cyclase/tetratricopeptide (TPR) repeat protein
VLFGGRCSSCSSAMSSENPVTERDQIERSIAALESQRIALGDAVVDSSIGILREKLGTIDRPILPAIDSAAERKLVTVMFADISGFTGLSERTDPERMRALINACFSWLVPIIEHYGGVVEKFIGDEIMAMFGAPIAHENDVERALRSAIEMVSALDRFNQQHGTSLSMHFGINTGTVVAGGLGADGHQQYGVMGDMVNVAARLCSLSQAGEIFVGPTTHRLAASQFEFDELAPARVKGKSEPISIHRLLRVGATRPPTRGIGGLHSPLIGRAAELQMLVQEVSDIGNRRGRAVCLLGDAGLGKSRLIFEARSTTGDRARWVEGRAHSFAEGISYGMARNMLDHLVGVTDEAAPDDIAVSLRAFVDRHLPDASDDAFPYLARLRDVPVDADAESVLKDLLPQALQTRMHAAFVDLIAAVARVGPLVLVWEDVHWIDHSSLMLLDALLTSSSEIALLQVLVFRPDEGRIWEWHRRTAARLVERYRVMEVAPLTASDSDVLADHLLKIDGMPPAVRQAILDKAEGNPFFLEELLRSLIDSGLVQIEGDRARATQAITELQIPDTLHATIAARIDRLSAGDKHMLQTASVIGRIFQRGVLGRVLRGEATDAAVGASLSELQQRELIRWRHELEYIFKHAVTHEVTYNGLLITRRKQLHFAIAEAMEVLLADQLSELAPSLAYHYEAAEAHEKAVHYFVSAGERAQQTYANQEALAFYRAAIRQCDLLHDKTRRAAIHESLGVVLSLIGEVDQAIAAYGHALADLREDDIVTRARLYRLQGNAYNVQRRTDEMLVVYDKALATLGNQRVDAMEEWIDLQLDRIWAFYFSQRLDELSEALDASRSTIEVHASLSQKARWYGSLAMADFQRFRYYQLPDATLENAKTYVEAAMASGNRRIFGRAQTILGFVHLWRDELDHAQRFLLRGLKDVEAVGDVDTLFINYNYMTLVGRKRGDVVLADEWACRTLALAEKATNAFYRTTALGSLAWVHLQRGTLEEARSYLGDALTAINTISSPIRFFVVGPALAIAVRDENWNAAVDHARTLLHRSQQKMPDEVESLLARAVQSWDAGDATATGPLLAESVTLMHSKRLGYV